MKKNIIRRLFAAGMVLMLAVSNLPLAAFATEEGKCPHHQHDESCGYVKGAPCGHEHGEDCYALVEKKDCPHQHTEDCDPALGKECTHDCKKSEACRKLTCKHEHSTECYPDGDTTQQPTACKHKHTLEAGCWTCTHKHDGSCGYVEAKPCTFKPEDCPECNPPKTMNEDGEDSKCGHGNDPDTCESCHPKEAPKCEHGNDPDTCESCHPKEAAKCEHGNAPATCESCHPKEAAKCEHGNDPATCEACHPKEAPKCEHGNDPDTCETCNPPEGPDPAVEAMNQAIYDLPTKTTLDKMTRAEKLTAYNAIQTLYGQYEAMTDAQKAQVKEPEVFQILLTYLADLATLENDTGAFVVTGDSGFEYKDDVLTIKDSGTYKISMKDSVTKTADRILVASDVDANITIENLNIDVDEIDDACAFEIQGSVNLTLSGVNLLKSGNNRAGLQVEVGARLTIDGNGDLHSYSGAGSGGNGAAIGGGVNGACGTITIKGGKINAFSYGKGAGIGGGVNGAGGIVTISGGIVSATSGRAAGIGAGENSNENGTFTANGDAWVYVKSIGDVSDSSNWQGIIFQGSVGEVCGDQTIDRDIELDDNEKLTIRQGSSLTINPGITLTMGEGGTLNNNGTLFLYGDIKNYDGSPAQLSGDIRNPSKLTLTINDGKPVNYGDTITLIATISELPKTKARVAAVDEVEFFADGESLGTAKLDAATNTATFEVTKPLAAGQHAFSAECGGKTGTAGNGFLEAQATKDLTINPASLSGATVALDQTSFDYDGQEKRPGVTVTMGTVTLTENTDYILTYENNIAVGQGKVTVRGIGNYTGEVSKTFTIASVDTTLNVTVKKDGVANPSAFTYGDTVTLEVTAQAKTKALDKNTVALYYGDTQLATAQSGTDGKYILTYNTADKKLPIGQNKLTVKFGGSDTLSPASAEVTVTLDKLPITAALEGKVTKTYDGTDKAAVTLKATGQGSDQITVTAPQAKYAKADVGSGIPVNLGTLTVGGQDGGWYQVASPVVKGDITKAEIGGKLTITGEAVYRKTLTAVYEPLHAETVSYQWYRDGEAIPGARRETYTPNTKDVGKSLSVMVTATDSNHFGSLTSDETDAVKKAPQEAPGKPKLSSRTRTSITLRKIGSNANSAAAEYSIDGGETWQTSTIFRNLKGGKKYSFLARYKETDGYYASPASEATIIATSTYYTSGGKLSQTGQLNWPIPVLTVAGILVMATGLYLTFRKEKRETYEK